MRERERERESTCICERKIKSEREFVCVEGEIVEKQGGKSKRRIKLLIRDAASGRCAVKRTKYLSPKKMLLIILYSLTLSLLFPQIDTHTLYLSLSLSLSHTHIDKHTLSLSHIDTQIHTPSFSIIRLSHIFLLG